MKTYQVNLLNPKAAKLLQQLAELRLIELKETHQQDFFKIVSKLRKKAIEKAPSLEEITEEVEKARASRYANK
jgi:hypothetical protein